MSYTLFIKFADSITDNEKNYYTNYQTKHNGDSGIDLINTHTFYVEPLKVGTIDFKIQCEMRNQNNELVSYYLYPRSSISKTDFMMANSVGIIDAGYRGHLMGMFDVIYVQETTVNKFDRHLQICAPGLIPIIVELVKTREELGENTARGDGGFGSTGK